MTPTRSRNPGLDTLRAAAIALVFMSHYAGFVSGWPIFGWLSEIGWVGVDLFFVLSGYLIANQLFAGIARGRVLSPARFYARRALRTLPVFWVVLAAYVLFPTALGGHAPPPPWRFLTFTQNIGLQAGTAFSHAWSLCVEEQFYLVLPVVLVVGVFLSRGRDAARVRRDTGAPAAATPTRAPRGLGRVHGWCLMAALLALGVGARIVLWRRYGGADDEQDYMSWIYYSTLCRFDEFLPGVAIAMVKNFHRPAWDRLMGQGGALFALGAAATLAMLTLADVAYFADGGGYRFFMTAFGYSLLALSFALLVAAALSRARTPLAWRVPGAASVALWSYSIYLSHKPLAMWLAQRLKPFDPPETVRATIIVLACVALGALLHRFVEAPFMALRDRLVPANFADGDGDRTPHRDASPSAGFAADAVSP